MSIWWFVLVILVAFGLGVVWGWVLCLERHRPDDASGGDPSFWQPSDFVAAEQWATAVQEWADSHDLTDPGEPS